MKGTTGLNVPNFSSLAQTKPSSFHLSTQSLIGLFKIPTVCLVWDSLDVGCIAEYRGISQPCPHETSVIWDATSIGCPCRFSPYVDFHLFFHPWYYFKSTWFFPLLEFWKSLLCVSWHSAELCVQLKLNCDFTLEKVNAKRSITV